jgi:ABC-type glycerol-3-phosphate transport system substrate-binding protein
MTRKPRIAINIILLFLVGCSPLAPLLSTPTPASAPEITATSQITPTATAPAQVPPNVLRVWLPPQFDPSTETLSAGLLNQRFRDFESDHPGIKIEVRIKNNMVDFLSATNRAAPNAMPDLVALSYHQMQTAASAGFLQPLDGLTDIMQDSDWYVFARELSSVQNVGYGIPFAADAQLMVYRSSIFEVFPSDWETLLKSGAQIIFPTSDSVHYFPMSLYLSAGGQFADADGVFNLDEDVLVQVLSFYQQAYEAGAIPTNIRDYQTDLQVLESYRNGESDIVVVWASSDIGVNSGEYASLLGLNDAPYSVGDGWGWVLADSNPESQPLVIELVSYLVENEYMAEWTHATGYLPTRPLALAGWEDDTVKDEFADVLLATHPVPPPEVVSVFDPLMQEALIRIFNGEQAEDVARSVIESLK